jgi:hypothetical protein
MLQHKMMYSIGTAIITGYAKSNATHALEKQSARVSALRMSLEIATFIEARASITDGSRD